MSEIFETISANLLEGNEEKVPELVQNALDQGLTPRDILEKGLLPGMDEVGARFERCEMFVPAILISAKAMQNGLDVLRPHLVATGTKPVGKIVLGTVKGDIHDIGKNLVGMMCEGAGFEVINLGFDVGPEKFIEAIKTHQPDIVGMSAMLTTTMLAMGHTIKAIQEANLRDKVKVIIGGAPVDSEIAKRIGADGYGYNAPVGVRLAKQLVGAG
ncbi:MAG: corrinoid protein [Desulfobacteraceae bacterium]|jgi:5-methyltetrahydrofolate--homocysteine methyltransferase